MSNLCALILAGGKSQRLDILSRFRAKAALPFGGKYRIIDFCLSNSMYSGIINVGILTQYAPVSLMKHIKTGQTWDLDRRQSGVQILQPYVHRGASNWYRGTADAIAQNLHFLHSCREEYVVILSGDHVYFMDYQKMLEYHVAKNADITIAVTSVSIQDAKRFGVLTLDKTGRISSFVEKPNHPSSSMVSMGIYMFRRTFLIEQMKELQKAQKHDMVYDFLMPIAHEKHVYGYPFHGYWKDIGTIKSYYQTNLALISPEAQLPLYSNEWKLLTPTEDRAPAIIGSKAKITNSLIPNGCQIYGTVVDSVLFPGCVVEEGAYVSSSILLNDTKVASHASVEMAIVDKHVMIGEQATIGYGNDYTVNKDLPEQLNDGLTIIGKGAKIPDAMQIGHNCKLDPGVGPEDFSGSTLASGSSLITSDFRYIY